MSSEVRPPPPELHPEPEVLSLGPPSGRRPVARRTRLGLGLLVCVLVLALGVWRLVPSPRPDFTLADLQGAYSGMVRSDGTNEVATVTRDRLTEPPATVSPVECTPLFAATLSNQFPATALDGVSTYWLNEGSATISLLSYRYGDREAADSQFDEIASALDTCAGRALTTDDSPGVTVAVQPVTAPQDVEDYLSYQVLTGPTSNRFTTDVARLDNTVTWQYRYEYGSSAQYSPAGAQQLMGSLVTQLRSVQELHR